MKLMNLDRHIYRLIEPDTPIWYLAPRSEDEAKATGKKPREGKPLTLRRALIITLTTRGTFDDAEESLKAYTIAQKISEADDEVEITATEFSLTRKMAEKVLYEDPDMLKAVITGLDEADAPQNVIEAHRDNEEAEEKAAG